MDPADDLREFLRFKTCSRFFSGRDRSVYGGLFGAGLSVMVLAVLGLFLDDSLTRLRRFEAGCLLCRECGGSRFLPVLGQVLWNIALVMAGGAMIGRSARRKTGRQDPPSTLRGI